jgi:hypothetical protein
MTTQELMVFVRTFLLTWAGFFAFCLVAELFRQVPAPHAAGESALLSFVVALCLTIYAIFLEGARRAGLERANQQRDKEKGGAKAPPSISDTKRMD